MNIWVLKDFRIGSSKQSCFLAHSLSENVTEKNIIYNKFISIPNIIKPLTCGIDFKKSDKLLEDNNFPDMIIFAGRRLAGLAIYLKKYIYKKTKKNIKLISILQPNYSYKNFDYVILPYHDNIKKDKYNNIIKINGSLCSIKIDESNFNFWDEKLKNNSSPFYSFLIGGDIKNKKMDSKLLLEELKKISDFVKSKNGTLLISTSRRTNDECINIINKENIDCNYYLYKWADKDKNNPYYYFIKKVNIVFITGDSISMISEIITLHKPVYVYKEESLLTKKHIEFCNNLIEQKIIRNLDKDDIKEFEFQNINELDKVIKQIKETYDN